MWLTELFLNVFISLLLGVSGINLLSWEYFSLVDKWKPFTPSGSWEAHQSLTCKTTGWVIHYDRWSMLWCFIFLFTVRALILITASLFHLHLDEGLSRSDLLSLPSPHAETGRGANIPQCQGGGRFIRWHMQSQTVPSRLPTYHWQVLADTLA